MYLRKTLKGGPLLETKKGPRRLPSLPEEVIGGGHHSRKQKKGDRRKKKNLMSYLTSSRTRRCASVSASAEGEMGDYGICPKVLMLGNCPNVRGRKDCYLTYYIRGRAGKGWRGEKGWGLVEGEIVLTRGGNSMRLKGKRGFGHVVRTMLTTIGERLAGILQTKRGKTTADAGYRVSKNGKGGGVDVVKNWKNEGGKTEKSFSFL